MPLPAMSPCAVRTLEPRCMNMVKSPERKRAANTSLENCRQPWCRSRAPLSLRWICPASNSCEYKSSFSCSSESISSCSRLLDGGNGIEGTLALRLSLLARHLLVAPASTLSAFKIHLASLFIAALTDEPIACSVHREEVLRLVRIGFQLLA